MATTSSSLGQVLLELLLLGLQRFVEHTCISLTSGVTV
ncbi:hypothetical protein TC41_0674 [Alicyclobacillus acidocaldarius subsp. acidocaldarius Tc-4-1]|uniref:Uncharacterized protein n=1 Tax=Alicyclobacillus acidocaldarius (strain Tc-4-1) TaxID=1048834 RepID=F8IDX8_ALIAT|nr:hypothetical protein TC41_0674 [Alicyclobacillus acidocaldarius subsp. acidocaldarius Tc-4-1]